MSVMFSSISSIRLATFTPFTKSIFCDISQMAFSFLFADVTDRIFKWHMERNINVTHYICDIRYLKYYDEEPDAMKE